LGKESKIKEKGKNIDSSVRRVVQRGRAIIRGLRTGTKKVK